MPAGEEVKALLINCTLKASPEKSNTEALAEVVAEALREDGIEMSSVRAVDHSIHPGVESDMGEGDEWPGIRAQILDAEILIFATPTWIGRPSSIAQRVLERMDAMPSETDDEERPVAYNHVAGVVVTGNEDGAHHVISEVSGALGDIGFTIPGQASTYWNKGPGPGEDSSETEEGHEWSHSTGRAAAANLIAAARALKANRSQRHPPNERWQEPADRVAELLRPGRALAGVRSFRVERLVMGRERARVALGPFAAIALVTVVLW